MDIKSSIICGLADRYHSRIASYVNIVGNIMGLWIAKKNNAQVYQHNGRPLPLLCIGSTDIPTDVTVLES